MHMPTPVFNCFCGMIADGMPDRYAEYFAWMDARSTPQCFTNDEWLGYLNDAGLFLDRWGKQCQAYGWSGVFLFGHHAGLYPLHRRDKFGLIEQIRGGFVPAIEPMSVTIDRRNGTLEFYRLEQEHIYHAA